MTEILSLPKSFAALADPTRWRILVRIGSEPASASALGRELPVSRQAVTKHLQALAEAGLVRQAKYGRELRYEAEGARLRELARSLDSVAAGWDRRLSAIKAAAESPPPTR